MIESIWINGTAGIEQILKVRKQIWPEEEAADPMDAWGRHMLLKENGEVIGCGSMLENLHHRFSFYKIGIVDGKRNEKRGDFMVKVMVNDAWEKGAAILAIDANQKSRSFFMKQGFLEESRNGNIIKMKRVLN